VPFPLLAHQAVVLPLARRRWFSGTALCIGSLTPDFEYLGGDRTPGVGHTLLGMIVTVPWAVILTLVTVSIAPTLFARFPYLARIGVRERSLPLTTLSAAIGVASHLFLDGATHKPGWSTRLFPALLRPWTLHHHTMPIVRFIHYGASVVLSLVALVMLAFLARRGADRPVPEIASGRLALIVSAAIGGWLGARWSKPVITQGSMYSYEPGLHAIGYTAFAVVCSAWAAMTLTAIWLSRSDASRSRRHAARPYSV
jgi:hypothetical protein